MKILKEKSREYKGQSYFKYKVNIPAKNLSESGLKDGDELDVTSQKGMIILRKIKKDENSQNKAV